MNNNKVENACSLIGSSSCLFGSIFNNSDELIAMHDLDGRIIMVNSVFLNYSNMAISDFVDLNIEDFFTKDSIKSYKNAMKIFKEKHKAHYNVTFCSKLNNCKETFLYVHIHEVEVSNKKIILWYGADISKQKATENNLRLTNRSLNEAIRLAGEMNENININTQIKDHFIAIISHELRTPLNGIMGISDILQEKIQDKEQISLVKTIQNSAKLMQDTINNMLVYAKLKDGSIKLNHEKINLIKMIDDICDDFNKIKSKDVAINVSYTQSTPLYLNTDHLRLKQILTGIIDNSVKNTSKGLIDISVKIIENNNDMLEITVKDTGTGIEKEKLSQIYKPFEQSEDIYTRVHNGIGLGLTNSFMLIKLMNGTINIESNKNKGTTVIIKLPFQNKNHENTKKTTLNQILIKHSTEDKKESYTQLEQSEYQNIKSFMASRFSKKEDIINNFKKFFDDINILYENVTEKYQIAGEKNIPPRELRKIFSTCKTVNASSLSLCVERIIKSYINSDSKEYQKELKSFNEIQKNIYNLFKADFLE